MTTIKLPKLPLSQISFRLEAFKLLKLAISRGMKADVARYRIESYWRNFEECEHTLSEGVFEHSFRQPRKEKPYGMITVPIMRSMCLVPNSTYIIDGKEANTYWMPTGEFASVDKDVSCVYEFADGLRWAMSDFGHNKFGLPQKEEKYMKYKREERRVSILKKRLKVA